MLTSFFTNEVPSALQNFHTGSALLYVTDVRRMQHYLILASILTCTCDGQTLTRTLCFLIVSSQHTHPLCNFLPQIQFSYFRYRKKFIFISLDCLKYYYYICVKNNITIMAIYYVISWQDYYCTD